MFEGNKITFQDYIDRIKKNLILHLIITIFSIFISLILLFMNFDINYGVLFIIDILVILVLLIKFYIYYNINKIQKFLIKKHLFNKIGMIEKLHNNLLFLTENYILILYKKNVYCFKYLEIKEIYKKFFNLFNVGAGNNRLELYLCIILKNGLEFNIFADTTYLFCYNDSQYEKICSYLLEKNPNIVVKEDVVKNKLGMR